MNYTSKSMECGPLKLWGPHNNALRIKPLMRCTALRLVVISVLFFDSVGDQLEQHVSVRLE